MLSTAIQVNLVGLAGFLKNFLRLVAQFSGEYSIGLGCGNGPRSSDSGELRVVDERRMGDEANLDAALVVAGNVLC